MLMTKMYAHDKDVIKASQTIPPGPDRLSGISSISCTTAAALVASGHLFQISVQGSCKSMQGGHHQRENDGMQLEMV